MQAKKVIKTAKKMKTFKLNLTNTSNKNILIIYFYICAMLIHIQLAYKLEIFLFKIHLKPRTPLASQTYGGNGSYIFTAKNENDL